MNHGPEILDAVLAVNKTLGPKGHWAFPPWHVEMLSRWLLSGKRTLVFRKPRRIGWSTGVAPQLGVAWALTMAPKLQLPPGEFVEIDFVSIVKDESGNRIDQVAAVLDGLGVPYDAKPSDNLITLRDLPVKFGVLTRNWRSSVGRLIGCLFCDEVPRWDEGVNPPHEVIASLKPSTLTVPGSLIALVGSPVGDTDYHAEQYNLGETPGQCVATCRTWDANPTISKQDCIDAEPDERTRRRDYYAEAQDPVLSAFIRELVLAGVRAVEGRILEPVGLVDMSQLLGQDATSWAVGGYVIPRVEIPAGVTRYESQDADGCPVWKYIDEHGEPYTPPSRKPVLVVHAVDFQPGRALSDTVYSKMVWRFQQWGVRKVFSDQYEALSTERSMREAGLRFGKLAWSNTSKNDAVIRARRLMSDRLLVLPDFPPLIKQLIEYRETVKGGLIKFGAPSSRHDDLAELVTLLCAAELNHELPGSPLGHSGGHRSFKSLDARQCLA